MIQLSDCVLVCLSVLLVFSWVGTSSEVNGTRWAVLIAGSNGYENYRHQADVCHAYQTLRKGGLKDENIVVMMYDDIAFHRKNPRPEIVINKPDGADVYHGVPKDYTGDHVNTQNFYAVLLGNKSALTGGSGKVVESGPNDHIFIFYADHGSPGLLGMPYGDDLVAKDFIEVLKKKHELGTYKKMVIYLEACESGSMFKGILPNNLNIYTVTASNAEESSWGTYCPDTYPPSPPEYNTCVGDVFSVSWLEDSDMHDMRKETLKDQYEVVRRRTAVGNSARENSHVMRYGTLSLQNDFLFSYIGTNPSNDNHTVTGLTGAAVLRSQTSFVDQRDVHLLYLQGRLRRASEGSQERVEAEKKLQEEINYREQIDENIQKISEILIGSDLQKSARPSDQPLVDDWDCFKTIVRSFKRSCGATMSYGMKYSGTLANMCNIFGAVKIPKIVSVIEQVCSGSI